MRLRFKHVMPRWPGTLPQAMLVVLLLTLPGCGEETVAPPDEAPIPNLGQIVVLYMNYFGSHRGVGPQSAEEFKRFIRTDAADQARGRGVDLARLDELFISPRDQQAYIINYNLRGGDTSNDLAIIVYEARGRDGKRAVAFINGKIDEVDASRAAELGLKSS